MVKWGECGCSTSQIINAAMPTDMMRDTKNKHSTAQKQPQQATPRPNLRLAGPFWGASGVLPLMFSMADVWSTLKKAVLRLNPKKIRKYKRQRRESLVLS
jgi:hypothetical protein